MPHSLASTDFVTTLDAVAANRWLQNISKPAKDSTSGQQNPSAFIAQEVAQRMLERLQWLTATPASWLHWLPTRGASFGIHSQIVQFYQSRLNTQPQATTLQTHIVEPEQRHAHYIQKLLSIDNQQSSRTFNSKAAKILNFIGKNIVKSSTNTYSTSPTVHTPLASLPCVDMLFANMTLHGYIHPTGVFEQWYKALNTDGFLMFSCLGPDTLKELRAVYQKHHWGPCAHDFLDMHDLGDMLLKTGFADPVMDTEHITLSYENTDKLLQDLRDLGHNMHKQRFQGFRGKQWLPVLHRALDVGLRPKPLAPMQLSFEIIYGYAIKPQAALTVQTNTTISLERMRRMLSDNKNDKL